MPQAAVIEPVRMAPEPLSRSSHKLLADGLMGVSMVEGFLSLTNTQ